MRRPHAEDRGAGRRQASLRARCSSRRTGPGGSRSCRWRPVMSTGLDPSPRSTRSHAWPTATRTLLADPELDAIYNPLPNGLHGHWTIAVAQRGQARAVREAVHGQRRRGPARGRGGGRASGTRGDGGVPLRVPPADTAPGGDRAVGRARHHQGDRHRLLGPDAQAERHPLPARPGGRRHDGHGLLPDLPAAPAGRGTEGHERHGQALLPRRRPRHGCDLLPPRGRHGPGAMLHVLVVGAAHARRGRRERRDAQGLQPVCTAVRTSRADRDGVGDTAARSSRGAPPTTTNSKRSLPRSRTARRSRRPRSTPSAPWS